MVKRNGHTIDFGEVGVFAHLEPHVLDALRNIATLYILNADEFLYQQGEMAQSFYVVQAGGVRLIDHTDEGRNLNLKIYGAGDVFGLLAVSGAYPHPSSIQAVQETTIISMRGDRARELMLVYPRLAVTLIDLLVQHIQHAHQRIRHIAAERMEKRIARAVLHFADKFGIHNPDGVVGIELTQQDLAEFIGTTLETVNRMLRTWEQNGWIKRSRQYIEIANRPMLQQLIERETTVMGEYPDL